MGDLTIRGHQAALGRGLQRALSTTVEANQSAKETVTNLGITSINFSSDNDFSIPVSYTNNQGQKAQLHVTPDDLETLKSIARGTANAMLPEPIEVLRNGQVIGQINPQALLSIPDQD